MSENDTPEIAKEDVPVKRGPGRPPKPKPTEEEIAAARAARTPPQNWMVFQIGKILTDVEKFDTDEEKVEYLLTHRSLQLIDVLRLIYDPRIKLAVKVGDFFRPASIKGFQNIYQAIRILGYLVKGSKEAEGISQDKKDTMAHELTANIITEEVFVLRAIFDKEPIEGLSKQVYDKFMSQVF